jgi:hypothetical protein
MLFRKKTVVLLLFVVLALTLLQLKKKRTEPNTKIRKLSLQDFKVQPLTKHKPEDFATLGANMRLYREEFTKLLLLRYHSKESRTAKPDDIPHDVFDKYVQYVNTLENNLFPWIKPHFNSMMELRDGFSKNGRGMVLGVNDRYVKMATTTIQVIRKVHNSNINIEIFYNGPGDLSKNSIKLLEEIPGVVCRDIQDIFDNNVLQLGGWAIKPFALLASSFREAILMDADVFLLQPPEMFFEQPLYKENNVLFFHDRSLFQSDQKNVDWIKTFVKEPYSETFSRLRYMNRLTAHEQESGKIAASRL